MIAVYGERVWWWINSLAIGFIRCHSSENNKKLVDRAREAERGQKNEREPVLQPARDSLGGVIMMDIELQMTISSFTMMKINGQAP